MIITCPRCFASYRVPDKALPAQGRRVRCSGCQFEWTETPTASTAEPESDDSHEQLSPPQEERVGRMADPVSSIESVRERMVRRGEETKRKEEHKKRKKSEPSQFWKTLVPVSQWTGLILASVLVIFAVFREPIGAHSAFFANLYEDMGVPVHTVYQWFDVKVDSLKTEEEAGRIAVVFSGSLSNISQRERVTPQIQFYLPKAGGNGWVEDVLHPTPSHLKMGESAHFEGRLSGVDLRAGSSLNFLLYKADEEVMDISKRAAAENSQKESDPSASPHESSAESPPAGAGEHKDSHSDKHP